MGLFLLGGIGDDPGFLAVHDQDFLSYAKNLGGSLYQGDCFTVIGSDGIFDAGLVRNAFFNS